MRHASISADFVPLGDTFLFANHGIDLIARGTETYAVCFISCSLLFDLDCM